MNDEIYLQKNERIPLPAGTQIVDDNGITYTIQSGSVGYGGTSLIYRAIRTNSGRLFAVKECYPVYDYGRLTRKDGVGVVCPTDPSDIEASNYLQKIKQNMMRENEISQSIANEYGRIIAPTENFNAVKIIINGKSYDAKGSFFIAMERLTLNTSYSKRDKGIFLKDLLKECSKPPDKMRPFRNGGLPSPYTIACIMQELLKALNNVHTAHYIHGDIQDENFFLLDYDPISGDIGVGVLLDFGSARKLEDDGKTAPIVDKRIYGTLGFCSPEMFFNNDGTLRLTPATDIFSTGCFLLYLIKGLDFKDTWGEDMISSFSMSLPVYDDELFQAGFSGRAAVHIKKILTCALDFDPSLRYQNAGEMLQDISKLKTLTRPLRFQLAKNLSQSFYWVNGSRDVELAALQKAINNPAPIYIYGLWGVGKTSLAIKFAMRQKERGIDAYLVNFRGTMKDTVLQMEFSNYKFIPDKNGAPQEQEYRERLDILRTDYVGSLLIVDNFERENTPLNELQRESAYKDIVNSGLHVIFITRERPDTYTTELSAINENAAFELYRNITGGDKETARQYTPEEEKIVRKLLAEVEHHTLTVELLASLVNESWNEISPQRLLSELKSRQIFFGDKSAVIYERVRLLFNLFKFDETYREIFCRLVFLPTEGFDATLWLSNEDPEKKKFLRRIETFGWIRRRRENNRLYMHSLIRKVILNEANPTFIDCDKFFARLWQQHFENQFPPDVALFRQAAELYERAGNVLQDVYGDYATHAGYSFFVIGNNAKAILSENKAIKIREAIKHEDLARNYNDISCAYLNLFDAEKSLAYLEKARKFLKSREPIKPELANVYTNLSVIYSELDQNDTALKYAQAAVELLRKNPPQNKFELANALTAHGKALIGKKKYDEATDNLRESLTISKEILPPNHTNLALAYLNLSDAFALSGNFSTALELANNALKIQEKSLPENHNEILKTWSLLVEIYRTIGNSDASKIYSDKLENAFTKKRLESAAKLIQINLNLIETKKKLLAKNLETKSGLAKSYRDVAGNYRTLGNFNNAKENIVTAMNLTENEQPNVDDIFNFLAASEIFDESGDTDKALCYAHRAFDAAERLDDKSSLLGTCCMRLGYLYEKRNIYAESLRFYEKSVSAELRRNYPDRNGINLAKSCMGKVLLHMGKIDEAKKFFAEVRVDKTTVLPDFHSDVKNIAIFLAETDRRKSK